MRKFRNFMFVAVLVGALWATRSNDFLNVLGANPAVEEETAPEPQPETEVPEVPKAPEAEVAKEPVAKVPDREQWPAFYPQPFYENIQMVEDPNNLLVLVGKNNQLSWDYYPEDLRLLNVPGLNGLPAIEKYLRDEAATAVESLFQAANEEAGLELWALSAFRSYQYQTDVYYGIVAESGVEEADRWSARPGHSEHQTGLALDITAASVNGNLVQWFEDTAEGIWLRENAHRFGFIIRYPRGREAEVGFAFEPWHVRYVGLEAAATIYENGLILEEYLLGIQQ